MTWDDPWSGDSIKNAFATSTTLLDKFLTRDSLVLSIYEFEVSFG